MHASFALVVAALASSAFAIPVASNSTTVTWTQTDTITKTSFIPTSTPAAISGASTYYSTWLATKVWTTTSCYETSSVKMIYPFTPSLPATTTTTKASSVPTGSCHAPTATVTVTETVTAPAGGSYYPPGQCHACQTITYTDVWGHVNTIAVPTHPSVASHVARGTYSIKTTSLPASSSTCGFGTGLGGKCAPATSSALGAGTGGLPHRPTAYPAHFW